MPANTTETHDHQPNNKESKIWRFMDFTKFLSLLTNKHLFFNKSNSFKDIFEGRYTKENLKSTDLVIKQKNDFLDIVRDHAYINCWHLNEHESAGMWDLYSNSSESIAIVTTYDKLKNAMPDCVSIGLVKYIDFNKSKIPEDNVTQPFLFKRKSFEHEKEARLIHYKKEIWRSHTGKDNYTYSPTPSGINIPIDLNLILTDIYISPTSKQWFYELVQQICKDYGIKNEINITKSELYEINY